MKNFKRPQTPHYGVFRNPFVVKAAKRRHKLDLQKSPMEMAAKKIKMIQHIMRSNPRMNVTLKLA